MNIKKWFPTIWRKKVETPVVNEKKKAEFTLLTYKEWCFATTFTIPERVVGTQVPKTIYSEERHKDLLPILDHFVDNVSLPLRLRYCGCRINLYNSGKNFMVFAYDRTRTFFFDLQILLAINSIIFQSTKAELRIPEIWCNSEGASNDEFVYYFPTAKVKGYVFPFKAFLLPVRKEVPSGHV